MANYHSPEMVAKREAAKRDLAIKYTRLMNAGWVPRNYDWIAPWGQEYHFIRAWGLFSSGLADEVLAGRMPPPPRSADMPWPQGETDD